MYCFLKTKFYSKGWISCSAPVGRRISASRVGPLLTLPPAAANAPQMLYLGFPVPQELHFRVQLEGGGKKVTLCGRKFFCQTILGDSIHNLLSRFDSQHQRITFMYPLNI